MRVLVLSDIHGNLAALKAVLASAEDAGGWDRVWVLGDTVGYGPQPGQCLALVRELDAMVVAGNHELAVLGRLDIALFNRSAAAAALWTAKELPKKELSYAASLPLTLVDQDVTLVHASPRDPVWEYVISLSDAAESMNVLTTHGCAGGHTHVPAWAELSDGAVTGGRASAGLAVQFAGEHFMFNPGSVGQPRDGNPRASFAMFDSAARAVTFMRCGYDFETTQRLMEAAGLPQGLIYRLSVGR